jgi:uncharacterized phage protein (TIGR01671 family)
MRDIEFRGKATHTGEWVYGDLCHNIPGNPMIEVRAGVHDGEDILVDSETVGQYTGLKDKNGQKIFEGDIIELNYGIFGKVSGVVTWSEKYCAFMAVEKDGSPLDLSRVDENPGAVEILGNIHDNPELLAEEEEYDG